MRIVQLKAENFRRFERLSLPLSSRLNLFVGENAAGKTSLLEMLYCLNRARSFRGNVMSELAGPASRQWTVFGASEDHDGLPHTSGVQWNGDALDIRVDRSAVRSMELLRLCPTQILEPGMHRVVLEGPTYRRSFIDWGVFHVEHSFLPTWRRYRRALKQRNQLLRTRRSSNEVAAWEPELAESGEALHALRVRHLASIATAVNERIRSFLDEGEWTFDLNPGWKADVALREALAQHRARDQELGTTSAGPHRAELKIRADARSVRNRISRGQQKLLLAAMLLAQCDEIARSSGRAPIVLIDDFTAELAPRFQARLADALAGYAGQSFVTAFEPVPSLDAVATMFHVEHGKVRR
ncbi:DNA replication/repair protein RecF [Solimonas marina]|uniref:DNA replication and repair protein RecF n=1 Tax=Solimonas marina TaxID=2714601 RepID=A0A969W5X4_9GAMM|nr:DNA replication/repair protein RecF [Solimonas marina]NKF21152.1 DNA replication/repair protein RecF [Solimonas marina]